MQQVMEENGMAWAGQPLFSRSRITPVGGPDCRVPGTAMIGETGGDGIRLFLLHKSWAGLVFTAQVRAEIPVSNKARLKLRPCILFLSAQNHAFYLAINMMTLLHLR